MSGPEIQNSNLSWRTAAILEYVGNAITRLIMDRFGRNLGGHIPLCPRHVRCGAVAMARPLPSNDALNIYQLWTT